MAARAEATRRDARTDWRETVTYSVSYVTPTGAGRVTARAGDGGGVLTDEAAAIREADRLQAVADGAAAAGLGRTWSVFYIVRREWRAERGGRVLGGSSVVHTTRPAEGRAVSLGAVLSW